MSKIADYIKSLLPSFETSRLKESLMSLQEEIMTFVAPAIEKLVPIFPTTWRWRNKDVRTIAEYIQNNAKIAKLPPRSNLITILNYSLKNMVLALPFMKGEVDKAFGRMVANDGLTFSKTTLIQYAEVAEFFVKYVQTLVNFITSAELNASESGQHLKGVAPDDITWLKANLPTFMTALRVMSLEVTQLKQDMHSIPNMLVDEASEDEAKILVGHGKMDPFGFATLPWPLSWGFHIQLYWANRQVDKYERAKIEAKAIEYRILLLKQQIEEQTTDAATEKLLEITEERLMKLRFRIAKMEEDYGLTN